VRILPSPSHRAGAEVILTAWREPALAAVAADIRAFGGRCTPISLDVTNTASIDGIRRQLQPVDILVNNADVVYPRVHWTYWKATGTR
jgi:NADP-dependent 3-hydroxy acid dehydrogenase YdfG